MTTLLIPSARYVDPEMQADLGRLPPVFLPLKNGILLEQQFKSLSNIPARRILSLPIDFDLPTWAEDIVGGLDLEIVRLDDRLNLSQSVAAVLLAAGIKEGGLRILHGDTIITNLDLTADDIVSMHKPVSAGYWAHREQGDSNASLLTNFVEDRESLALSGFFSFSSARLFGQSLRQTDDFVDAINDYHRKTPVQESRSGKWYDFGHLKTYFLSRQRFTTERHFNRLAFDRHTVIKSGDGGTKIAAEAAWFEALPKKLHLYTPRILSQNADSYEIEYLHLMTLSELYAFGDVPITEWNRIARSCGEFLSACRTYKADHDSGWERLTNEKTWSRLRDFSNSRQIDLDHPWIVNGSDVGSIREAVDRALSCVSAPGQTTIMHGDFCFSNILYDSRAGLIRTIDPRGGIDTNHPTIYGDQRYDLGKLFHSFAGHYDLIIADQYSLDISAPNCVDISFQLSPKQQEIQRIFESVLTDSGFGDMRVTRAVAVLLFLSMPPLHSDRPDRQEAFLVNGLRLASELLP